MVPSNRFAIIIAVILPLLVFGCGDNKPAAESWSQLIPQEAPVTYAPGGNPSIDSLLKSPYIPFLNDITASSVRLISDLSLNSMPSLPTQAIYLFPSSANQWKPVWITKGSSNYVEQLSEKFAQPYAQKEYLFEDIPIKIIRLKQRKIFVAQLNSWILISENSLALEESIRSYTGLAAPLDVEQSQLMGRKMVLNTPFLDQWVKQLAKVTYRPSISGAFSGTKPVVLDLREFPESNTKMLALSGVLSVASEGTSTLVESISAQNDDFQLDQNIPEQAAAYSIFHLPASLAPPKEIPHPSKLDSMLINNPQLYQRFARSLHPEFAITMFSESGYLSAGEHFYLRRLNNEERLREALRDLINDEMITRQDQVYNINSQVLAQLFGSSLCTFDEFYLGISNEAVVLSKRKGLTESVLSDTRRNRVIAYQKMYKSIIDDYNNPLSALAVAEGRPFLQFVEPYLTPDHYVDALLSQFDILSVGFRKIAPEETEVTLNTYKQPETTAPYQEKWAYALSGTELTGGPVLADIGGSPREEIVFATRSGRVHALASDGTEIVQASTGTDTPVGSPLVYDWYGNGQNIILQAAGNKIYGWNTRGNLLPQFPMPLDETVSSRPRIADVNRDGIPELIVATTNRKVHVLNGRGNDITGWPQKTNAIVNQTPAFEKINDHWSIIAFAANTLHAWLIDGDMRPGFPKFLQATFRGEPVVHNNHIFANAANGHLYTISEEPPFADSLRVTRDQSINEEDSLQVAAINLAEQGLAGTPSFHSLSLRPNREDTLTSGTSSSDAVQRTYMLTSSSDGSIFFLNPSGTIQQSYKISQSLDSNQSPFLGDLKQNRSPDLFVTSRFGRLYAWNLGSGRRSFNLPTQSMHHPILTDIDGDGNLDLIAQSQNSLICWTLLNP